MNRKSLVVSFIRKYCFSQLLRISLLALLSAVLVAPVPFIYRRVIDGLGVLSGNEIMLYSLLYVFLIGIGFLLDFTKQMILMSFQYEAAFSVTTDIYRSILRLPYHIISQKENADIIKLFQNDGANLYNMITFGVINTISILIRFGVDVIVCCWLFGSYVLLLLVPLVPVYYLLVRRGAQITDEQGKDYENKLDAWYGDSYSPLYRLKEVKAKRIEPFLLKNVMTSFIQLKDAGRAYGKKSTILYKIIDFFDRGLYLASFLLGIWAVTKGYITLGTLFAAFSVLSSIIANLNELSLSIINDYQKRLPSLDRLVEFYSIQVSVPIAEPEEKVETSINLQNVEFSYPNSSFHLSLPNLTLSGCRKYVIVGKNGAGKSTLLDLISGLKFSQEGSITINGVPTNEIADEWWRKNLFLLLQDAYLFKGSIEQNILMEDCEEQRNLQELVQNNGFSPFFQRFKDGLKTQLGEGITLSGGEKRLISILRLLLRPQYQIILVDEGKSGLDAELRHQFDDKMAQILAGKLSLTITHNLNELSKYDEVLFVDNGKILSGSHEHLLKTVDEYRDFIAKEDKYETI